MQTESVRRPDGTWEAGASERDGRVREALLESVVAEVAATGYEAATFAAICARAGVDAATGLRHFAGKEDCYLAAAHRFVAALLDAVKAAVRRATDWETGTGDGLGAFLSYLADHPAAARAFLGEGLSAGRQALAVRDMAMRAFCDYIDMVQLHTPDLQRPPAPVTEASVGGIYGIVAARIRSGETACLPALRGSLAYFLAAAVGRPRARRELTAAG
jgi:AcrR family transcriptional regulator